MIARLRNWVSKSEIAWVVALAFLLLFPSLDLLQRYLDRPLALVYVVALIVFLLLVSRYPLTRRLQRLAQKHLVWWMAGTVLILAIVFVIVYPLANSSVPGQGSDRDEALNLATIALLRGEYPYYVTIYSGNPITPLPGAMILAAPFVLMGNSAYQNFFWLFALLLTARSLFADETHSLVLLWVVLLFSPVVLHEVVTGGDLLANSLYILLCSLWAVRFLPRKESGPLGKLLLAVLLGVAFSSRFNFLVLFPLVFATVARRSDWKSALRYAAVTLLTFTLLTLPFYIYDPLGFSPLHTVNKLGQFQSTLPLAGFIVPGLGFVLASTFSLVHLDGSSRRLLWDSALVLALPVLGANLLQAMSTGRLSFTWVGLGITFLFFGVLALWPPCFAAAHAPDVRERIG